MYTAYANMIAAEVASGGPHAARSSGVKYMRGVKRSVLKLVEVCVCVCMCVCLCVCALQQCVCEPAGLLCG